MPPELANRSIVVVDDDRMMCELEKTILTAAGAVVSATQDSEHAVPFVADVHPDLVVLDVDMPVVNGWDLAGALALDPETAEIPIVFVTGSADPGRHELARVAGAMGVVEKPFDPDLLVAAVSDALAKQRSLRPAITGA
jgi:CheY-like chemotaxis protein